MFLFSKCIKMCYRKINKVSVRKHIMVCFATTNSLKPSIYTCCCDCRHAMILSNEEQKYQSSYRSLVSMNVIKLHLYYFCPAFAIKPSLHSSQFIIHDLNCILYCCFLQLKRVLTRAFDMIEKCSFGRAFIRRQTSGT